MMIKRFFHTGWMLCSVVLLFSGCLKKEDSADAVFEQFVQDNTVIMRYLKYKGIDSGFVQHPTGLVYKIMDKGNGRDTIGLDNIPVVIYTRSLLKEDRVIESSNNLPTSFDDRRLKDHIAGWRTGLRLITKGGRIIMCIPSGLAFGPEGIPGLVPPNAILMCDVTLTDFK